MSETENVSFKTYDARGNGDGETTCTLTGNHQSFVSDYTALAVAYRKQAHPMNAEQGQGWEETEKNDTLNCHDNGESRTPTLIVENHPNDSRVKITNVVQTLNGRMGTGGGNVPLVMENLQEPCSWDEKQITPTLTARNAGGCQRMPDKDNFQAVIEPTAIVRRLTPMECERLQGYPDNWTNIGEWTDSKGKLHKESSDSSRYKALGNSIALPYWDWMAKRMVNILKQEGVESPTMASLFDGIGGFPLVYSRHGCTPVWASEIEEFPIAVTKYHFPENGGV